MTRSELAEVAVQNRRVAAELAEVAVDRYSKVSELSEVAADLDRTMSELAEVAADRDKKTSELETLKSQQINAGVLREAMVSKLVQTKGFVTYVSDLCQEIVKEVQSATLNTLGDMYPHLGLRRKKLRWHPEASEMARRCYAKKVNSVLPKFRLLEHLKTHEGPLTLEQLRDLDVDFDDQLDRASEPLGNFQDLDQDPSEVH